VASDTRFEGEGPIHHGRRAVEEARACKDALGSQLQDLGKTLDLNGRVQRNPFGMLAAAAGVGYLLGGGLFSPLTGKLLRVGLRLALIPVIKSQLASLAGAQR
jgi:hypothetical protein